MKLLLFSDVHRDLGACKHLATLAAADDIDVVVGAGDFAVQHGGLHDTIEALSSISKPSVLVPGNNETEDELRNAVAHAWPAAIVLHAGGMEVEGVPFFGVGGGVPITPFGSWSYDFTEDQAREMLAECPENAVLVSHSPPKGHGDRTSGEHSHGSVAVLETIHERSPRLCVCGHIHDSWGYDARDGETRIINAGPKGVIVEI